MDLSFRKIEEMNPIDKIFEYKYDERAMKLKSEIVLTRISFFIVSGMLFFVLWTIRPSYYSETKVDYSELNQTQRELAYSLISDLKPEFLQLAKTIKFVTNQSEMVDIQTAGQNDEKGNILVLWSDNERWLREVVCHECIHTAVELGYDFEEKIVYEMGKTGVCYV